MKLVMQMFAVVHAAMAALFALAALSLMVIAAKEGWMAASQQLDAAAAQGIMEAIGLLAAGVVALQIAQTIAEEEVVRDAHISAPTRLRRYLSRFLVVVVVALVIEGLVATFKAIHENRAELPLAAALIAATGLLLACWGVFVRLNCFAEQLEPEAMEEAKREDSKLKE